MATRRRITAQPLDASLVFLAVVATAFTLLVCFALIAGYIAKVTV